MRLTSFQAAIVLSVMLVSPGRSSGEAPAPTAPAPTAPNQVAQLYYQGLVHFRTKHYQKALPFFEKAVALDPDFAPAYLSWQRAFNAHGNYTLPRKLKLERVLIYGDIIVCPTGSNADMREPARKFDLGNDRLLMFCGWISRKISMPKYEVLDVPGFDIWYYDAKSKQQKLVLASKKAELSSPLVRNYAPDNVAAIFDEGILFDFETNLPEIWKVHHVICAKDKCRVSKQAGCEFRKPPKSYMQKIGRYPDLAAAWEKDPSLSTPIIAAALLGHKKALAVARKHKPKDASGRCGCTRHWERKLVDRWISECRPPSGQTGNR